MKNNSDSAWKDILDAYFKEFVEYCLPNVSALIDWHKPCVLLDKELQMIMRGAKTGKRLLDKLFKVYLRNGQEQWILIHVEIQQTKETDFARRMFVYNYRIFDKYQQAILSCAILTDRNKHWRPNSFKIGFADSYLCSRFVVIKMIDYRNQLKEIEESNNIFACIIYSQIGAIDLFKKPEEVRKQEKFALTKRLYNKGFNKDEISNLYKFIDWLICLPKPLEIEYINDVNQLEEMNKMAYVTSMERFGKIVFRNQGRQEEKNEIAKRMLEAGFDLKMIQKMTKLTNEEIEGLIAVVL